MTSFDTPEKNINLYTKRFFYQKTDDPHDIFHARAALAIPENKRNHFMICGCAYVYGRSWGISWYGIQKMFKSRMPYDNKTDWLKLYFGVLEINLHFFELILQPLGSNSFRISGCGQC